MDSIDTNKVPEDEQVPEDNDDYEEEETYPEDDDKEEGYSNDTQKEKPRRQWSYAGDYEKTLQLVKQKKNTIRAQKEHTNMKKKVLKKFKGVNTNKGDGPNLTTLLENLRITINSKTGKTNDMRFRNEKIIISEGDELVYSKNKNLPKTIAEFETLWTLARGKHEKTTNGLIQKKLEEDVGLDDVNDELVNNIRGSTLEEVTDELEQETKRLGQEIHTMGILSEQEKRQIGGLLRFDEQKGQSPKEQIKNLELMKKTGLKNDKEFEELMIAAQENGYNDRANFLKEVVELINLREDKIRLKHNLVPKSEEA